MPSVVIIGAGIGGLSLALELHARGHDCRVFDAAPGVTSVGVGINIQDYASRHLHRLGLRNELRNASMCPSESVFASAAGQVLLRESIGLASGSDFPQYSIHRMALQRILFNTVEQRLGRGRVMFGRRLLYFEQHTQSISAMFHGSSDPVNADVLVGCDGVHSAVCKQLHPQCAALQRPGITMWRGLTRGVAMANPHQVARCGRIATGKLVAYPVKDPDNLDEVVVNWVAELRDDQVMEQRHLTVPPSSVAATFYALKLEGLDIPSLIRHADFVLQLPMADRDPLPYWSRGRVTLLGDAAHPMYPVGSNGAGQAILDAAVLAACLDANPVEVGLLEYDALRRPATAAIVEHDRAGGPDVVLEAIHNVTGGAWFPDAQQDNVQNRLRELLLAYRHRSGIAPLASCHAPIISKAFMSE